MARIQSMEMGHDEALITLRVTKKECQLLNFVTEELILLPTDETSLNEILTTGKLGSGNRIMMPNKILKRHNIKKLIKKAPSRIFEGDHGKYLLIRLDQFKIGVPSFAIEREKPATRNK